MEAFPDAKVVLSVRNPQTWYKSVRESIYKFHVLREDPAVRIFGYLIGKKKNMECVDDISLHPPKVGLTNASWGQIRGVQSALSGVEQILRAF